MALFSILGWLQCTKFTNYLISMCCSNSRKQVRALERGMKLPVRKWFINAHNWASFRNLRATRKNNENKGLPFWISKIFDGIICVCFLFAINCFNKSRIKLHLKRYRQTYQLISEPPIGITWALLCFFLVAHIWYILVQHASVYMWAAEEHKAVVIES